MTNGPFYRRLDDDLFPELQFGVGRRGIRAQVIWPASDPRVPAPADACVLLVVFRLALPPPQPLSANRPADWTLAFDRHDAEGRLVREQREVLPEPRHGDDSQRPLPDAGPAPQGQLIYRGAWWTDLAGDWAGAALRPGRALEVELAYAGLDSMRLTLP